MKQAYLSQTAQPSFSSELLRPISFWLNVVVVSTGWGSSFLFIKLISDSMPPFAFGAARGFIAFSALLVWLFFAGYTAKVCHSQSRFPNWGNLRHMVVLGTTNGWLPCSLMISAMVHIDSAFAAMIQAIVPLVVAGLAHVLLNNEKLQLQQIVGLFTGLFGLVVMLGPMAIAESSSVIGICAMLMTACCFAASTVYARRAVLHDFAFVACGQQFCGALVAGGISLLFEPQVIGLQTPKTWLLIGLVGVLCSAAPTLLYMRLVARTTAVAAALVAYLQPLWATVLGWIVLGEYESPISIMGTCIVLIAIAITTSRAHAVHHDRATDKQAIGHAGRRSARSTNRLDRKLHATWNRAIGRT